MLAISERYADGQVSREEVVAAAHPAWEAVGMGFDSSVESRGREDTPEKRARHARDLDAALRSSTTLPLARLLVDANYPAAAHRAAFYAQSMSLVELLTELESPRTFVQFVKHSTEQGTDRALLTTYGLSTRELERRWHERLSGIQLASADSRQ